MLSEPINARLLDPSKRQRCEVWTRVMGYHRPVSEFNPGKKSEHYERVRFIEPAVSSRGVRVHETVCA